MEQQQEEQEQQPQEPPPKTEEAVQEPQPSNEIPTTTATTAVPTIMSSVLAPATVKRLAWYFGLQESSAEDCGKAVDQYLTSLPPLNEAEVLVQFSRMTRQYAGEDASTFDQLDEAADAKRLRLLTQAEQPRMSVMQHQQMQSTAAGRKRKRTAIIEDGKHVAAKIDNGQEWNLMTVLRYVKKSHTYVLEDADEQVEKKDEIEVSKNLVLPLSCPEYSFGPFPVGARVLAMYPGTTSFYFAKVIKCSKRVAKRSQAKQSVMFDYQVQYDEDEIGPDGELVVHTIKGEFVAEAPDA